MPPAGMPQNMPKVDRKVVVSKEVKAKWKAVKIAVENKKAKTTKEYTVNVGGDLAIPNTKLTVKVLNFLPDFKMTDKEFTSASDKPNMPAAQVAVLRERQGDLEQLVVLRCSPAFIRSSMKRRASRSWAEFPSSRSVTEYIRRIRAQVHLHLCTLFLMRP